MGLTVAQIRKAGTDGELLKLLQAELNRHFPPAAQRDVHVLLSRFQKAPQGLRAMAATYDLDVSMALDDLAWHFRNHPSLDWYEATLSGLRELEAFEETELFEKTFSILKPHWTELENMALDADSAAFHRWLDESGIQESIDPLNDQMWKLLNQWPSEGLMHYWTAYARKYPERCITRG